MCGVDSHIADIVATNVLSGSMDRRRNTSDGDTTGATLTLFDPMTHTPLGLVFHIYSLMCDLLTLVNISGSGLGDHGTKGFQDFAESHQCSHICRELHLCTMDEIKATIEQLERRVDSDSELDI